VSMAVMTWQVVFMNGAPIGMWTPIIQNLHTRTQKARI